MFGTVPFTPSHAASSILSDPKTGFGYSVKEKTFFFFFSEFLFDLEPAIMLMLFPRSRSLLLLLLHVLPMYVLFVDQSAWFTFANILGSYSTADFELLCSTFFYYSSTFLKIAGFEKKNPRIYARGPQPISVLLPISTHASSDQIRGSAARVRPQKSF